MIFDLNFFGFFINFCHPDKLASYLVEQKKVFDFYLLTKTQNQQQIDPFGYSKVLLNYGCFEEVGLILQDFEFEKVDDNQY